MRCGIPANSLARELMIVWGHRSRHAVGALRRASSLALPGLTTAHLGGRA